MKKVRAKSDKQEYRRPNQCSLTTGIIMLLSKFREDGVDKRSGSLCLFGTVDRALVKVITGMESFGLGKEILLITLGRLQVM
jgi:hypothetical protein